MSRPDEASVSAGPPVERGSERPNRRTLEGIKAHGRIGRATFSQESRTVRTHRWSKALKLAAPFRPGWLSQLATAAMGAWSIRNARQDDDTSVSPVLAHLVPPPPCDFGHRGLNRRELVWWWRWSFASDIERW